MATVKSGNKRRIREILRSEGRSLRWLAERTGYTADHISRVDSGQHPGTVKFWRLMESVLGPLNGASGKAA